MAKKSAGGTSNIIVKHGAGAGEVATIAARELAAGLSAMLGCKGAARSDPAIDSRTTIVALGPDTVSAPNANPLIDDSFGISRAGKNAIAIQAGSERGLLHASYDLMERLGARSIPGAPTTFPKIEASALTKLKPYTVTPAFKRRAFVSDLMTWNYTYPDRLELHLKFDREFMPWFARRGINAFEYIRHAHDAKLRIDELLPLHKAYGIGAEYGGHVLPVLMPRENFEKHPEHFPSAPDGKRMARGNLCVSNPDAIKTVCDGALVYQREYPENQLLHIWGADVREGAWCSCPECKKLSPQLQYMKVVNAVAAAEGSADNAIPVAYLAYHDTMDPDPKLRPLPNVWFEWAPRERCYIHAIDDAACTINPRYFESLKKYIDIFKGRGHVFEYYADAILFGGLGFATPAVIARDLRAYKALGIDSISSMTFGAYSVLAYPVNLEAFVRGTRSPDFSPNKVLADCAANRHPQAAEALGKAYRAIEKAAALVLDFADVMRPFKMTPQKAGMKKPQIVKAIEHLDSAVKLAKQVKEKHSDVLAGAEEELWSYSLEALSGIGDYLRAREEKGIVRITLGDGAVALVATAIEHIRPIDLDLKGTWGAYDLEWIRELWLDGLRKNLAAGGTKDDEMF
ncbi:MAG TPA: DUF4838 domain-containing protein [Candidatus Binataceae bacterium]|nr:DUF4838 domain-containing protein [Candidatus Binataceae bacterium]